MNMLLVSNYQKGIGGISAQVDLLQSYLQTEGWSVDIFSTKGNPLRRLKQMVRLLCCAKKYDILHIHACSYWGMVPAIMGIFVGKLWRRRIVVTYHGGEARQFLKKNASWVTRWLKRADQVIVPSGFLKEIFDHYDIPCIVIHNIVILQPQIKSIAGSIRPYFISIRHLEPLYNIPCILQAYQQVKTIYPNATLDILGQGSMRFELEQYVVDHNVKDVQFIGQVSNAQIYSYLAKADVMLSAPKIDNMPVSLLEAMNAGVLVISSRVGGIPFIIKHRETGLLFENENADDLAQKMLWAVNHPIDVFQIIRQAQNDVQKYSWKNIKLKLLKVYG